MPLSRLPPRWRARLLTLLALYFTFLGGTLITEAGSGGAWSLWLRVGHHALLSLLAGGWLISLLVRRQSWPATPLDVPILVYLSVAALATALAVDPRVSLEEGWRLGLHTLLFYMLVDLIRSHSPRAVLEPIFFASAVVILVAGMEMSAWYFGVPPLPYFPQPWFEIGGLRQPIPPVIHRLNFTMLVSTTLSAYMSLLIPVGLAWAISTTSRDTRRAMTVWLAGAALVVMFSFSRGGFLALTVALPVFGLLVLVDSPGGWRARIAALGRDRRVLGGAAILATVGIVAMLLWFRQAGLAGHASGDRVRLDLWRSAWQIGLSHPVLGVGPYGFGRAMREYRNPLITHDGLTSPHNVPLLVWAEMGGPGVAALFVLGISVAWAGLRRWRMVRGRERVRVAGVCAALLGFAALNLFDTYSSTTPVLLPALALVAYLIGPLRSAAERASRVRRWAPALVLGLVMLAGIGWAISDAAHIRFTRAIRLADQNDLQGAVVEIDAARRIDPALGLYAAQRAQFLGRLAASNDAYLPAALEAYRVTLSYEDTYDLIHANYAALLAESGDWEGALTHMQQAARIQPGEARYSLWSGDFAAALSQDGVAHSAYTEAMERDPHLAASAYWDATPRRTTAHDAFLRVKGLEGFDRGTLSALPDLCWPFLVTPPMEPVSDPLELRCRGEISLRVDRQPSQAMGWLDRAIAADPAAGQSYAARAEASALMGNLPAAERDARIALFLNDRRGFYVLGLIEEAMGNAESAEQYYLQAGPLIVQRQGWDVAVYGRRGSLLLLPLPTLDAPGPSRYDLAAWLALARLYEALGRTSDAQAVYEAIRALDPFFDFHTAMPLKATTCG